MPGVSSAMIGSAEHWRRHRAQRVEQLLGVMLDRRDAVPREQFGEQPHHHLAVLQHVGDAGGRAGIILEHVETFRRHPHDVDAGDMRVDVVGDMSARSSRPEHRVLKYQVLRDDAGAQHLAPRHRRP